MQDGLRPGVVSFAYEPARTVAGIVADIEGFEAHRSLGSRRSSFRGGVDIVVSGCYKGVAFNALPEGLLGKKAV